MAFFASENVPGSAGGRVSCSVARTRQMNTELLVSGTPEKWIEGKFFTAEVSTLIYVIIVLG